MSKYLLRLDDASEYMDVERWKKMETLLDEFDIKPIIGIIPNNLDPSLINKYKKNLKFWDEMRCLVEKGWTPALHGYEHQYVTKSGGVNPVNYRSEFAGLEYEVQADKIEKGWKILKAEHISPNLFFAPSHTFDKNTLEAIRNKTNIRVISDTVAFDVYKKWGFWFLPQQSGVVRKLPFNLVTFCYHPNTMSDKDFSLLREFLKNNSKKFIEYSDDILKDRPIRFFDIILQKIYFLRRKL